MPVYLLTLHGYRTWMPDHPSGYTRRRAGHLEPDDEMAENYARRANRDDATVFDAEVQRILIEEALMAAGHQHFRLHAAASDPTHLHCLAGWSDDRGWVRVRTGLKTSLSRRLKAVNQESIARGHSARSLQLSRGASRNHVTDREHFSYLMQTYLPDHRGVCWFEDRGWVEPR